MKHLLLAALLLCSCSSSEATSPFLEGQEFACPAGGLIETEIEGNYPLVVLCSAANCRPASWTISDSLYIPCSRGETAVINWW